MLELDPLYYQEIVETIAKKYSKRALGFNDLVNEGFVGVLKALRRVKKRGFKNDEVFINYVKQYIRGEIRYALKRNYFIPVSIQELRKYRRGIRTKTTEAAGQTFAMHRRSFSSKLLASEDSNQEWVWYILSRLRPVESEVLQFTLGLDGSSARSFQEVSDITGIDRDKCRHIKNQAVCKLRKIVKRKKYYESDKNSINARR